MKNKENEAALCNIETGICSTDGMSNIENSKTVDLNKASDLKIIYYFDALCGWCYGFSSVMSEIENTYGDKINIEVVSGGLFLNERVGSVNEIAPYIKQGAYKSVESRTGVKFGEPFLNDIFVEEKIILNSVPPAIALCIVKEKYPEKQSEFAETLLYAVYYDGRNPSDPNDFVQYAEEVGFTKEDFLTKMSDPKYGVLAEKDFQKFQASQFSGMPTLVLETKEKSVVLSNGYTEFEKIKSQLDQILNNQ